jgi:NAD(P)H-flavin reductase
MRHAVVMKNEPAGTLLRTVELDLLPDDYDRPGQWAKVAIGEIEAPFAIASSPGEPMLLLAKAFGPAGNALCAAVPGTPLRVGPASGGYAMARVAGLPLVLLASGSGISALRPVVQTEVRAGMPRPVHLLYGVMTPSHRSFLADLERWGNAGVKVHTVVDSPANTGWTGATGYVQDVAEELGLVRPDVGVLVAGVPAMIDAARTKWMAAGLPADRLLVNF